MFYFYIRLLASDQKHVATQPNDVPLSTSNTDIAEDIHLPNVSELNLATLQEAIQSSI